MSLRTVSQGSKVLIGVIVSRRDYFSLKLDIALLRFRWRSRSPK
jgi:hypothetical protein